MLCFIGLRSNKQLTRRRDGGFGKGRTEMDGLERERLMEREDAYEGIILCLTQEKFRFTVPPAVVVELYD
jgi:hypothetical protein